MIHDVFYAVWFFLPAGAANLVPVLVAKLPFMSSWNAPLDGRVKYQGRRLLGSSKTWRGLVCGVLAAVLVFWLQKKLSLHLGDFTAYLQTAGYDDFSLWLGFLLGSGALVGDSIESFFKRRIAVAPGKSWFPFDQTDYVIGGCLASLLVTRLPLHIYPWVLLIWFLLHLGVSYIGYLLHFKKTPI